MMGLFFFCGYETLSCSAQCRTELLNICLREQITYRNFTVLEDGGISLTVSMYAAKKLSAACASAGISLHREQQGGLPYLAIRYRKRAGIFAGTLIAIFLLLLSERYVWDIRISGNESMTHEEVVAELNACGFGIGSYIPDVETVVLENRVLIASDRISWIAIELDGTVAQVQIIENTSAPPEEDLSRPANLIATADGQIESVALFRGNCMVSVGQAVKKGDLLVSGLYDTANGGYRYTRAAGEVLARTERTVCVEIPFADTQKVYEEEKCREIVLNFFGFSIKIFKSTGNLPLECDIIEKNEILELFGVSDLPIGWTVTTAKCYRTEPITRTREEALTLAYEELEQKLAALSTDVQLLSKVITTEWNDGSVRLVCTLRCIENIAEQSEIELTD
ncbi:MAG: sporulation protein YqfD [Clostridia bacterium]|nr:sporulation protein YqfD [Clostridia bacterium]